MHHESLCCFQVGDEVTKDEPLTTNPNVGGFGQDGIRSLGSVTGDSTEGTSALPLRQPERVEDRDWLSRMLVTPLKTNELIPTIAMFFCFSEVTFCNPSPRLLVSATTACPYFFGGIRISLMNHQTEMLNTMMGS